MYLSTILAILLQTIPSNVAVPTDRLGWDQAAANLQQAQQLIYELTVDTNTAPVILLDVNCTGTTSPFKCDAKYPLMSPGEHRVTLVANDGTGVKSAPSQPFSFRLAVIPATPSNLRNEKQQGF